MVNVQLFEFILNFFLFLGFAGGSNLNDDYGFKLWSEGNNLKC